MGRVDFSKHGVKICFVKIEKWSQRAGLQVFEILEARQEILAMKQVNMNKK